MAVALDVASILLLLLLFIGVVGVTVVVGVAVVVEVVVATLSQEGHMVRVVAGSVMWNGFEVFKALNS